MLENGEDSEPEEDFEWLTDLKNEQPDTYGSETFFTFINQMRKPMEAGSQAWNCYGNRSNIFLLVNYGFCFQDNLYDSHKFMVRLDLDFSKQGFPGVDEMLSRKFAS